MDAKTCVELLHTLSELKSLYSEYKFTTGHLKHFFDKHFDYFAHKKDAAPDTHLFKFCDETKQIKDNADISLLQKNIDEKMNTLETGLHNLKIMDPFQKTGGHSTVITQRAHKLKRTEVMDMPTLKRERERLLQLQERHENRITQLATELKQTKHKFETMEATLSQERSKFTQIKEELQLATCKNETLTGKVDELQILLEEGKKDKKPLEKYQREKFKHKHKREDLDHTNCQNNTMTKKVEELQVQILKTMTNNKCLEGKFKKECSTYMNTIVEMERHTQELQVELDKTLTEYKILKEKYQNDVSEYKTKHEETNKNMKELQVNLKQMLTEYKSLEGKYQNIKSDYTRKNEGFDQDIKELQDQLRQAFQENKHLEEKYQDEMVTQEKTRSEFHQSITELQLQLKQVEEEKKLGEETFQNEKHIYEKRQAEFELAISKLQSQLRQAEEKNKSIEECQVEVYVLQNRRKELEEENQYVRERYQIEISHHKNTRDKLNQEITELQVQLNLAEEEKAGLETKHVNEIRTREELNRAAEELKHQLKQVENENKCVEQKYQHEFSKHRATCEELDKARCEKQSLIEKLEDFEQQRDSGMLMKDLQIQQLQANEKKLKEDLLTLEHTKAENTRCIENLREKLHSCGVFMRYLLDTRNKLRDNLSNKDKFYREREKRYVKLVKMHIRKQHEARKKLEKMKISAQTWPHKLCCWWNEKVQRHKTSMSTWDEETNIYPDDGRLPGIGKTHIETSKCNKNDKSFRN